MTDLEQRLSALASSNVADAQGGRGLVGTGLVRLSGRGTVAGRAVTAACDDGSAGGAVYAMADAQPGDVLCIAAPGETAYIGDLFLTEVRNRGIAGVVIDGYLRDVDALPGLGISCWARGVTPLRTGTRSPGQPMVPIEMGQTMVRPGDWIVADGDGVMVIPGDELDTVLERAEAQVSFDARVRELIAGGATLLEAFTAAGGH